MAICYKDMTYCPYWKTCKDGKGCNRALTKEVVAGAKRWMPDIDPPGLIAMFYMKPDCYERKAR